MTDSLLKISPKSKPGVRLLVDGGDFLIESEQEFADCGDFVGWMCGLRLSGPNNAMEMEFDFPVDDTSQSFRQAAWLVVGFADSNDFVE